MNTELFFKHLAEVTGTDVDEISRSLFPEYWKDMCSFGHVRAYKILQKYATNRKIREFESYPGGFRIKIPETDINPRGSKFSSINLYITGSYARIFKKEFPEFIYPKEF